MQGGPGLGNHQHLRNQLRAQALYHMLVIRSYRQRFRIQLRTFIQGLSQQMIAIKNQILFLMGWIRDNLILNFRQVIRDLRDFAIHKIRWIIRKIGQGFELGYRLLIQLMTKTFSLLKDILTEVGRFLYRLPEYIIHFYQNFFTIMRNLADIAMEVFNTLGTVARAIAKLAKFIVNGLVEFGRYVLENLNQIALTVLKELATAGKWVLKKMGSQAWLMVGLLLGVSAATIDFGGELLNYATSSVGLDLAEYAAFESFKWGLTLILASAGAIAIAQYSFTGLVGLFLAAQAARLIPTPPAVNNDLNVQPQDQPGLDPILNVANVANQPAIVPMYQQGLDQGANQGWGAPVPALNHHANNVTQENPNHRMR